VPDAAAAAAASKVTQEGRCGASLSQRVPLVVSATAHAAIEGLARAGDTEREVLELTEFEFEFV